MEILKSNHDYLGGAYMDVEVEIHSSLLFWD